jgi:prevent-host-death family protein
MTTVKVTQARAELYRLIDQVTETHEPVHITGRHNAAVLVAEEDWRAIQETLYLLSVPGMREAITEGMATPKDECEAEPGW